MPEPDDHDLLASYARKNSEAAFAALVERHINLVYSVAWRSVGNTHAAEEITQAVFIILAQKAGSISSKAILSGWLHQTALLTASNFLRGEIRRQKREQEAYMQSTLNQPDTEIWLRIAPTLDEALGKLGERDRNAIVLRFFENKSLREVGSAMGTGEDAAKMRVNRALDKLRKIFTKRGVTFSAAAIAGAVAANSVHAAPAGLAKSAAVAALAGGTTDSISTLTLIKETLKIMAWTKAKTAIVTGATVLLVAGAIVITTKEMSRQRDGSSAGLAGRHSDLAALQGAWSGQEIGVAGAASPSLVVQGSNVEFHGADPREWYKATFSIREDLTPKQLVFVITDCPIPQYAGKKGNAIYQLQDGTLTFSGNEPGDPAMPGSFDSPNARKFVFTKK